MATESSLGIRHFAADSPRSGIFGVHRIYDFAVYCLP
jgi:hypothetical protein